MRTKGRKRTMTTRIIYLTGQDERATFEELEFVGRVEQRMVFGSKWLVGHTRAGHKVGVPCFRVLLVNAAT